MFEKIIVLIIQELGPTGLLICGLYFFLGKHLGKISRCIETINHNTTSIKDALIALIEYQKTK